MPVTDPLDRAVLAALARTGIPGAVLTVSRRGRVEVRRAWGAARTHDDRGPLTEPVPMRTDTLVDIASITKVTVTTAVAMVLVQEGQLDLEAPVERFLPAFRGGARERITVRHLLEHRSGLPDWAPLFLAANDPVGAIAALCEQPLVAAPGSVRVYSDLGMALLGAVLEAVGGVTLDVLARRLVHEPLGMRSSMFCPGAGPAAGAAATSTGNPVERRMVAERHPGRAGEAGWWRDRVLVGEVNDANAAVAFHGVAGHAGLFSTAEDLLRFGGELLAAAHGRDGRVFGVEVVRRFTAPGADPGQGLGFWTRRLAGRLPPEGDGSFGHRGFTGCELLVEPASQRVVVLLSNRLHGGDPPPPHDELWRSVLEAVLGARGAD